MEGALVWHSSRRSRNMVTGSLCPNKARMYTISVDRLLTVVDSSSKIANFLLPSTILWVTRFLILDPICLGMFAQDTFD